MYDNYYHLGAFAVLQLSFCSMWKWCSGLTDNRLRICIHGNLNLTVLIMMNGCSKLRL